MMVEHNTQQNTLSALEWQIACGADMPFTKQPNDWYQAQSIKPIMPVKPIMAMKPKTASNQYINGQNINTQNVATKPTVQQSITPKPIAGSMEAIKQATKIANDCNDWQNLISAIKDFRNHPLQPTAQHCLTHQGNPTSNIIIIGDAPSKEDDLKDDDLNGGLFNGDAGKLLDNMLATIKLSRDDVLLTNITYWRPPGGRSLTDNEIEICRPFFEKMLALSEANIIMALGNVASKALLAGNASQDETSIESAGGKQNFTSYQNQNMTRKCNFIASLHPQFLLKVPEKKRNAWHDLLAIQQLITDNR